MILVERHQIRKSSPFFKECDNLSYISKNLYNSALYYVRGFYFSRNKDISSLIEQKIVNGKSLNYWVFDKAELYHALKNTPEFRTNTHIEYNGFQCNTKILKQTFIQLNRVFKSYVKATNSYYKNPKLFTGKPKIPNYKDKNGRNEVTVPKDAISFVKKTGYAKLANTNIYVKLINASEGTTKEIKIVPKNGYYEILVSYEVPDKQLLMNGMSSKIAGIDVGLNNLMALSSNDTGFMPFLINGRPLKSINQYYNKKATKYKSLLPKDVYWSKKLSNLTKKRNNKIHTELHNATTFVVDELVKNGIDTLIVGNNKGIKQGIGIGRTNNQNFVSIPFYKMRNMLKYKCEQVGIMYIETEESYTSKCSFLDMEDIQKQSLYKGNRTRRGLFVNSHGNEINSDLNGSLNIIRKVAGNHVFVYQNTFDLVEGYAVSPLKVTICS